MFVTHNSIKLLNAYVYEKEKGEKMKIAIQNQFNK
jgi:hypothetical protein